MVENPWHEADRISDRLVNIINDELDHKTDILQILAGFMLGMMALLTTAPTESRPATFIRMQSAIETCLGSLLHK